MDVKLQNYGGTIALLPPVPDERKHTELKTALRSQPNWLGSVFSPAVHSSRGQPHPLTFSASRYFTSVFPGELPTVNKGCAMGYFGWREDEKFSGARWID